MSHQTVMPVGFCFKIITKNKVSISHAVVQEGTTEGALVLFPDTTCGNSFTISASNIHTHLELESMSASCQVSFLGIWVVKLAFAQFTVETDNFAFIILNLVKILSAWGATLGCCQLKLICTISKLWDIS